MLNKTNCPVPTPTQVFAYTLISLVSKKLSYIKKKRKLKKVLKIVASFLFISVLNVKVAKAEHSILLRLEELLVKFNMYTLFRTNWAVPVMLHHYKIYKENQLVNRLVPLCLKFHQNKMPMEIIHHMFKVSLKKEYFQSEFLKMIFALSVK